MKYKVVGWTDYDDIEIMDGECTDAAIAAIVDDIKANGYSFSGHAHQEYDCGVPVLNDGLARRFSARSWGSVMAKANGYFDYMDYSSFAFSFDLEDEIMPDADRWYSEGDGFELCEADKFSFEVTAQVLDSIATTGEYLCDDTDALRYLEIGDTAVFTDGERQLEMIIDTYERAWLYGYGKDKRVVFFDELSYLLYSHLKSEVEKANYAYSQGTKKIKLVLKQK